MAIPNQTLNVNDPGLGIVEPAPSSPLVLGVSELGTANTLYPFSRKNDVVSTLGQGPLSEAVCKILDVAGGPVYAMPLNSSVAATNGSVTKTAAGSSTGTVAASGTPLDAYEIIIEIMKTGTVGVGTFRYSLDDGRNFSGEIIIPAGGAFTIPSTGVTATFTPGAGPVFFEDGDLFEWDTTEPYYGTTDVNAAVTALLLLSTEYPFIVLTGTPTSAAAGNTMLAALDGHATSFENANRYLAFIMDVGDDTTANILSTVTAESRRVMPVYGTTDINTSKNFAGWGTPKRSGVEILGAHAAAQLISTDLGRVASGALPGVVGVSHDEALNEVLDVARISTFRSLVGRNGFFMTNGRIKAPSGSDFRFWQFRRVMDVACRRVFIEQQNFLNIGVRTNPDGTIDERDATRLESLVNDALAIELTAPNNAEGNRGHVSEFAYTIDRTNNVNTTLTILSELAIRPLGYAKFIITDLGFATNLAA